MNNQVLHLANQGVTINQIHNVYEVPKGLQNKWFCRGYHGSPQHNSRGVIQRYLGFWDCNPTTLIPLSPGDSAPLYVEMMGGAEKILARGRDLHDEGKYLLAQEIVNKLVQAEPQNQVAKDLLADIFEQLGYQQENPGLRNSYLAAAYELRSGIPQGETVDSSSPDVIRAMSTELFLNFLGIRMDSRKAEGMRFTINLITPDNGEKFLVELENATLTNIKGFLARKPDLTLTINRSDFEQTMMGTKTSRSPDCGRNREGGGRRRHLEAARLDHGRFRPTLRDHARHQSQGNRGGACRSLRGCSAANHRRIAHPMLCYAGLSAMGRYCRKTPSDYG